MAKGTFFDRLKHKGRRTLKRTFAIPCADPVLVFGNQKSGTTAIARLLAEATGETYSHDMLFHNSWRSVQPLYRGETNLQQIRHALRHEFARKIIKDPDLTLCMDDARKTIPKARAVFVVREPAANIRSMLSRLKIRGDKPALDDEDHDILAKLPLWNDVLHPEGDVLGGASSYIEALARRWNVMSSMAITHENWMVTIRYEDFIADKVGEINSLAQNVGLTPNHDISHRVNHQFQGRGSSEAFETFFGTDNLQTIRSICQDNAAHFGY
ncbi:MAG: sulfotransferase domain-containing protein [Pseudomonadota bacterium]